MYLLKGHVLSKTTGADFANKSSYRDYLSSSNNGLLLDGDSLRLSEQESFQNVCVMAPVKLHVTLSPMYWIRLVKNARW